MEASTTMRKMLAANKIAVPPYQRAYSWDTPSDKQGAKTQTDVFLHDLERYIESNARSPYYFGHFLLEEREQEFRVIDGQQRLTTIVTFLSFLLAALKRRRELTEEESQCYEDMVMRGSKRRFYTVEYDDQFFVDYVITQTKTEKIGIDTASSRRIVAASDFFKEHLSKQKEQYLTKMLLAISNSACTTHLVQDESEAIQMFIFQNSRGKNPSDLEIIKAQFMYHVHLHGGEEKNSLVHEIKNRFETIYKAISSIDDRIDEDDVLLHTSRVHFNSLWEGSVREKIEKQLSRESPVAFIKAFTQSLMKSFAYLSEFFGKDERENMAIHSLITLGDIGIALPFIIKAYQFGLKGDEVGQICVCFESLVLRHRLIGTRAGLTSRINEVFVGFTEQKRQIKPIIEITARMKTSTEWWWAYWNNDSLRASLQGGIEHSVAKYLLWKYENDLEAQGNRGYAPSRFDKIEKPELEHVAPTTEPAVRPHGYCEYDDEFRKQYLDCLGNYLLLSKSHNCAVGNVPFAEKRKTYTHNEQQREIQRLVPENGVWSKEIIRNRKEKIVDFILRKF